jgi:glucokinase
MMTTSTWILGDIGGTHSRFAVLFDGDIIHHAQFENHDQASLAHVLRKYLQTLPVDKLPKNLLLAVAGPVQADQSVHLTNLGWDINAMQLAQEIEFTRVHLVNDFTALAMSMPRLQPEDLAQIGDGAPIQGAPMAILGPGTGLGVSGLIPKHGAWAAIVGEGGHATLPAMDAREADILQGLRADCKHVSAERILSGPGLKLLYEYIAKEAGQTHTAPKPEQITHLAISEEDPVAVEALAHFFRFLGTVAGDLALTLGAQGGVYLAGGILPQLVDQMRNSDFRQRFICKGRYEAYLKVIPTYVILDKLAPFKGLQAIVEEEAAF